MDPQEVPNTPKYRTVTYGRIVIYYREQKSDPNRVCITAGDNIIKYPIKLTSKTSDLTISKILSNSVLSTDGERIMCININNFYLCAPMDIYIYTQIPLKVLP